MKSVFIEEAKEEKSKRNKEEIVFAD